MLTYNKENNSRWWGGSVGQIGGWHWQSDPTTRPHEELCKNM